MEKTKITEMVGIAIYPGYQPIIQLIKAVDMRFKSVVTIFDVFNWENCS